MNHTTFDKEKLAQKLMKDWLKSIRLCGAFDWLGMDSSNYRPHYIDDVLMLLGVKITVTTDQITAKYEKKIIEMDFFEFSDDGLKNLTEEMMDEIKNESKLN